LIVRPAAEPFLYDAEAIFFLQDRYIQSSTEQLIGLLNWPFTWIGNPNSLLINGKGIAPQCQVGGLNFNDTLVCLETCQDDKTTLLNVTEVEEGKTYRFRIINAGQLVMANFAIAQHNLTVVQVEGTNVNSFTVDSIDIAPGQRYDVLVVMDQPAGSYLIETTVRERNMPPELKGQAILQYVDATNLTFPQESPAQPAWNETSYGVNFEKNLTTLDVTEHSESTALTADESKIKRFIVVGTQNGMVNCF
jgi:FtsP/CotA-like multicopper oxidase with cupredoxin domain